MLHFNALWTKPWGIPNDPKRPLGIQSYRETNNNPLYCLSPPVAGFSQQPSMTPLKEPINGSNISPCDCCGAMYIDTTKIYKGILDREYLDNEGMYKSGVTSTPGITFYNGDVDVSHLGKEFKVHKVWYGKNALTVVCAKEFNYDKAAPITYPTINFAGYGFYLAEEWRVEQPYVGGRSSDEEPFYFVRLAYTKWDSIEWDMARKGHGCIIYIANQKYLIDDAIATKRFVKPLVHEKGIINYNYGPDSNPRLNLIIW